jgi:hypothetical protein
MPLFEEIQAALIRCLDQQPPSGPELKLSADSNQLANVFAEMDYFDEKERPLSKLTSAQRDAFERWEK